MPKLASLLLQALVFRQHTCGSSGRGYEAVPSSGVRARPSPVRVKTLEYTWLMQAISSVQDDSALSRLSTHPFQGFQFFSHKKRALKAILV